MITPAISNAVTTATVLRIPRTQQSSFSPGQLFDSQKNLPSTHDNVVLMMCRNKGNGISSSVLKEFPTMWKKTNPSSVDPFPCSGCPSRK